MTTIVVTRKAMYSDSLCTGEPSFDVPKVHYQKSKHGEVLFGGCGLAVEIALLENLLRRDGIHDLWRVTLEPTWPPEMLKDGNSEIVVLTRKGDLYLLDHNAVPFQISTDTYAIGTGALWATAAMDHGATPERAIEYACRKDPGSRGPIQKVTFPKVKRAK